MKLIPNYSSSYFNEVRQILSQHMIGSCQNALESRIGIYAFCVNATERVETFSHRVIQGGKVVDSYLFLVVSIFVHLYLF